MNYRGTSPPSNIHYYLVRFCVCRRFPRKRGKILYSGTRFWERPGLALVPNVPIHNAHPMPQYSIILSVLWILSILSSLSADNPPPGIPVPEPTRIELEKGVAELGKDIEKLRSNLLSKPELSRLIPDVVIYYNAVRYALVHDQFYRDEKPNEFDIALEFLESGKNRARSLGNGEAPWTRQTGLVARGYTSKIDQSVQPYGLEIPDTYDFDTPQTHRLDIWYHGRGNTLSEIKFIHDRENQLGKFHSPNTIVVHPFGRYCNANKFAGETDTFEVIDSVSEHYQIDNDRIAVRGFSMGGAVTWHMATHHAGRWVVAAPGAGFAETAIYADVMNKSPIPTLYELKLHNLYDATKYARNLFHCPTIAYSGSEDKQKQAADIMSEYMKKEKLDLLHVIGAGMGHKYDDASIQTINDQVQSWANEPINHYPKEIRFTTYTLRYNEMLWLTVEGLEEHWKRSDITAKVIDNKSIEIESSNINGLALTLSPELLSVAPNSKIEILIDGDQLKVPALKAELGYRVILSKSNGNWSSNKRIHAGEMKKSHGLQGPIDDAFTNSFLFVIPTQKGSSKTFDQWVNRESKEAVLQWWRQFRGEVQSKKDSEITESDIENCNLILWGDPSSNQIIARIKEKLPFEWDAKEFQIDGETYSTDQHAPVMIYPNPLNPKRYIVINTGFTFSKFSGGSNSLQVPKLPDWAVLDLIETQNSKYPIGVEDAGFFDEHWHLKDR